MPLACTSRRQRARRWTRRSASTSSLRRPSSTSRQDIDLHGRAGRARRLRPMDIFDALIQSHELQRSIAKRLLSDIGDNAQRASDFQQLKSELIAHETAEERAFCVPLIEIDETVEAARHGIAEHHQMDEMVECIE